MTTCSATTPTITSTKLPKGLNLVDNGNGTATISGTFNSKDMGVYTSTITATGSGIDAGLSNTQTLEFSVFHPLTFSSKPNYTGTVGVPIFTTTDTTGFPVTATGFPTPDVSESGTLPTGVTFDSSADTLEGTPASGTQGAYPVTFTASDAGFMPSVKQAFTLTIVPADHAPIIWSAAKDTIIAGAPMAPFSVTAACYPYAKLKATALPSGLKFTADTANGTATITGTPARSDGTFRITITAKNKFGTVTQAFTLVIKS